MRANTEARIVPHYGTPQRVNAAVVAKHALVAARGHAHQKSTWSPTESLRSTSSTLGQCDKEKSGELKETSETGQPRAQCVLRGTRCGRANEFPPAAKPVQGARCYWRCRERQRVSAVAAMVSTRLAGSAGADNATRPMLFMITGLSLSASTNGFACARRAAANLCQASQLSPKHQRPCAGGAAVRGGGTTSVAPATAASANTSTRKSRCSVQHCRCMLTAPGTTSLGWRR